MGSGRTTDAGTTVEAVIAVGSGSRTFITTTDTVGAQGSVPMGSGRTTDSATTVGAVIAVGSRRPIAVDTGGTIDASFY